MNWVMEGRLLSSQWIEVAKDGVMDESCRILIGSAARRLKGHQRRLFIAEVTLALCVENARHSEEDFGCRALYRELRRAGTASQRGAESAVGGGHSSARRTAHA